MKTWLAIAVTAAMVTLGTSCGGNDPFTMFGDPTADPSNTLNLPVDQALINQVGAFSSSQDGISMSYNAIGATASVTAPFSGSIVNVDNTTNPGFVAITIYHNARLSSKLSFLQITSVRQGDYVNAGDIVGTLNNFSYGVLQGLKLSVYVNGSSIAVCPFSFLTQTARGVYSTRFGGAFPCQ